MEKDFDNPRLPYGVDILIVDRGVLLQGSNLKRAIGKKAADALESFLIALAGEGVDLTDDRFASALNTTVEAIANNS